MIQCGICASIFKGEDAVIHGCVNCQKGEWKQSLTTKSNEYGNKIKSWHLKELKGWGLIEGYSEKLKRKCLEKRIKGIYNDELLKELNSPKAV